MRPQADVAYTMGGVAVLFSILLIWQIISVTNIIPATIFPSASVVLISLFGLISSGVFLGELVPTLTRLVEGYFMASAIAVVLGIAMGLNRTAYTTGDYLVQFLRPMPSIILIPLAILYFGLGDSMIVSLIVYACIWPTLINTIDGVKSIDKGLLDMAYSYRIRGIKRITKIILPASAPFIFSGLRVSLGFAWIITVTTEVIAAALTKGIGAAIFTYLGSGNLTAIYSTVILVGAVAYASNALFVVVQSIILPWLGPYQKRH